MIGSPLLPAAFHCIMIEVVVSVVSSLYTPAGSLGGPVQVIVGVVSVAIVSILVVIVASVVVVDVVM